MNANDLNNLNDILGSPPEGAVQSSRRRLTGWFEATAPLIYWHGIESPLGSLYIASTEQGLCALDFGMGEEVFLNTLDPLARTEQASKPLLAITAQLREYFDGQRTAFDIRIDLKRLTAFQRHVLAATSGIPTGAMWTYKRVAETIGKPKASRAVGQALGRNPIPIVIPCHRVIASDGKLGGYSGGGGLTSKKHLLRLEGAL